MGRISREGTEHGVRSAQRYVAHDFAQERDGTLERRITRAELAPVARQLGLAPAQVHQVVALPSAYLAEAAPADGRTGTPSLWTWAEGIGRALVPEATARGRFGN